MQRSTFKFTGFAWSAIGFLVAARILLIGFSTDYHAQRNVKFSGHDWASFYYGTIFHGSIDAFSKEKASESPKGNSSVWSALEQKLLTPHPPFWHEAKPGWIFLNIVWVLLFGPSQASFHYSYFLIFLFQLLGALAFYRLARLYLDRAGALFGLFLVVVSPYLSFFVEWKIYILPSVPFFILGAASLLGDNDRQSRLLPIIATAGWWGPGLLINPRLIIPISMIVLSKLVHEVMVRGISANLLRVTARAGGSIALALAVTGLYDLFIYASFGEFGNSPSTLYFWQDVWHQLVINTKDTYQAWEWIPWISFFPHFVWATEGPPATVLYIMATLFLFFQVGKWIKSGRNHRGTTGPEKKESQAVLVGLFLGPVQAILIYGLHLPYNGRQYVFCMFGLILSAGFLFQYLKDRLIVLPSGLLSKTALSLLILFGCYQFGLQLNMYYILGSRTVCGTFETSRSHCGVKIVEARDLSSLDIEKSKVEGNGFPIQKGTPVIVTSSTPLKSSSQTPEPFTALFCDYRFLVPWAVDRTQSVAFLRNGEPPPYEKKYIYLAGDGSTGTAAMLWKIFKQCPSIGFVFFAAKASSVLFPFTVFDG